MAEGRLPGSPTNPERRVEEVAERYLDDLLAGESPDREGIVAAHPEIGDVLRRRLALVEMLYRARPRKR